MANSDGMSQNEMETAINNTASDMLQEVSGAVKKASNGDFSSLLPVIVDYVVPVVSALLILIVGYFLARFLSRIASAPVRKKVDETVGLFVGKLVFYTILVFTILGVLGRFGISVASFAAVLAAAGFAVGLAFQGTLSNFAAGILLLVFRPFKVRDYVTAGGVTGRIDEIDLFTTSFITLDNRKIIVPNSSIFGSTIENVTFFPVRRVDVAVGVAYSANIAKTREVLEGIRERLASDVVEGDDYGMQVVLIGLGESAVNWEVRLWAKTSEFLAVKQRLIEAVKVSLDEAGIGIPFPQMDIHFFPADSACGEEKKGKPAD